MLTTTRPSGIKENQMQTNINPNPRPKASPVKIDPNTGAPKVPVIDAQPRRRDISLTQLRGGR
jgi:hypothetical protein